MLGKGAHYEDAGAGEKEEHEKFQAFTNAQQEKGDGAGRKQKAKLEK